MKIADSFRQRHREALRQLVGDMVRQHLDRKGATAYITKLLNNNNVG